MPSILVLDGSQRSSLAAVRSLGRRGLSVRVADSAEKPLAGASKYVQQCLKYIDPAADAGRFLEWLSLNSRGDDGEMILPMTDTTMMLALGDKRLADRVIGPTREAYESLSDKIELLRRATSIGIQSPESVTVEHADAAIQAIRVMGFPAVLKPARSRYWHAGRVCSTSVRIVHDMRQAADAVRSAEWLGPLSGLVQRYVPGYGAGVFMLCEDGVPIASFSHRRIREKPPAGGVSVLCESAAIQSEMRHQAAALLESVRWTGPAMVEFRVSAEQAPALMEVNGRFWGSLQLAVDAGVDFPWLAYQVATKVTPQTTHTYRQGARLHWILGDLDNLLIQLRDRDVRRSTTSKLLAITNFLGTCIDPKARAEIFRLSDPMPGILEVITWAKSIMRS